MTSKPVLLMVVCAASLVSCDAGTASTASSASALTTAQNTYCTNAAAADACRQTFDTCIAAEAADVTACQSALEGCLPAAPEHATGDGCQGMTGDGGRHGRNRHQGEAGGTAPSATEVQACRDVLSACLAANPNDQSCLSTERSCVRAAYLSAFEAACTAAQSACTTDCAEIIDRCAQGIGGGTADGGSCETTATID